MTKFHYQENVPVLSEKYFNDIKICSLFISKHTQIPDSNESIEYVLCSL